MIKETKFNSRELEFMENLVDEAATEAIKVKLVNLWLQSQGGKDELGSEIAAAKIEENNKYIGIVKQKMEFFGDLLKKYG